MEKEGTQFGRMSKLEAMYYEHGPVVMNFLRRRTGSQSAEDIFQETFAQALCHLHRLESVHSVRAWLISIARNLFLNELRKKRIKSFENLQDYPAESETKENPQLERMHMAIDRLSAEHQEVLLLKWHDELSYKEIAQILKVPVGTVRSRLHHALGKLRDMLRPESVEFNRNRKE